MSGLASTIGNLPATSTLPTSTSRRRQALSPPAPLQLDPRPHARRFDREASVPSKPARSPITYAADVAGGDGQDLSRNVQVHRDFRHCYPARRSDRRLSTSSSYTPNGFRAFDWTTRATDGREGIEGGPSVRSVRPVPELDAERSLGQPVLPFNRTPAHTSGCRGNNVHLVRRRRISRCP